jgi:hypothetical protein
VLHYVASPNRKNLSGSHVLEMQRPRSVASGLQDVEAGDGVVPGEKSLPQSMARRGRTIAPVVEAVYVWCRPLQAELVEK